MNKLKYGCLFFCVFLIALMLVACSGATPNPSKVDNSGSGESTLPSEGVFSITQARFAAEKAALAMYDAVSAKMQQSTATLTSNTMKIDFPSDEGHIGAGSYMEIVPSDGGNYEIESFVIYKEADVEPVYTIMKATSMDMYFNNLDVTLFALADENQSPVKGAIWNEMPAVFLVAAKGNDVTEMIKTFINNWNPE